MALNFQGVRFQALTNVDLMQGWSLTKLQNFLNKELEDIHNIEGYVNSLKLDLDQKTLQAYPVNKIKFNSDTLGFSETKQSLIKKIQEARQTKLNLLNTAKEIKKAKNAIDVENKRKDPTFQGNSHSGGGAHEAYSRVMDALSSQAADIRDTYDSDEVITIDDFVIRDSITYEEALEKVIEMRQHRYENATPLSPEE